jgi:hypothetical protein
MFLEAVLDEMHNDVFYFDFLLGFTTMFFWIRFLLMLRLTEMFGPMI